MNIVGQYDHNQDQTFDHPFRFLIGHLCFTKPKDPAADESNAVSIVS